MCVFFSDEFVLKRWNINNVSSLCGSTQTNYSLLCQQRRPYLTKSERTLFSLMPCSKPKGTFEGFRGCEKTTKGLKKTSKRQSGLFNIWHFGDTDRPTFPFTCFPFSSFYPLSALKRGISLNDSSYSKKKSNVLRLNMKLIINSIIQNLHKNAITCSAFETAFLFRWCHQALFIFNSTP